MKSMTGFAKRQCNINGKTITVEIKTLNSKQLDVNMKLPASFRELELQIRSLINRLERGKIDFILTEESAVSSGIQLNSELAKVRYTEITNLADSLGDTIDRSSLLATVLQQPDVWTSISDEIGDNEWLQLSDIIESTISDVDKTRLHEGLIMKTDIEKHVNIIEQHLRDIPQYEDERITSAKERIRNYLSDANIKDIDENRFEQELIYYLEKLDITEEKVRLAKHINYFREVMENEESCGKKLGFIVQEMGREINTTGSKANHIEIQRLVVMMKDELEKIKEQLGNIL